jgi:hypothetical protein
MGVTTRARERAAAAKRSPLLDLPPEVLSLVVDRLDLHQRRLLAQTCRDQTAPFRMWHSEVHGYATLRRACETKLSVTDAEEWKQLLGDLTTHPVVLGRAGGALRMLHGVISALLCVSFRTHFTLQELVTLFLETVTRVVAFRQGDGVEFEADPALLVPRAAGVLLGLVTAHPHAKDLTAAARTLVSSAKRLSQFTSQLCAFVWALGRTPLAGAVLVVLRQEHSTQAECGRRQHLACLMSVDEQPAEPTRDELYRMVVGASHAAASGAPAHPALVDTCAEAIDAGVQLATIAACATLDALPQLLLALLSVRTLRTNPTMRSLLRFFPDEVRASVLAPHWSQEDMRFLLELHPLRQEDCTQAAADGFASALLRSPHADLDLLDTLESCTKKSIWWIAFASLLKRPPYGTRFPRMYSTMYIQACRRVALRPGDEGYNARIRAALRMYLARLGFME